MLLFYLWLASTPFLSISPWQSIFHTSFYIGYLYLVLWVLAIAGCVFFNKNSLAEMKAVLSKNKAFYWLISGFIIWNIISLVFNWHSIFAPSYMVEASGLKGPHYYNLFYLAYLLLNVAMLYFIHLICRSREKLISVVNFIFYASAAAALYGILTIWGYMLGFVKTLVYPVYQLPRVYGTAIEPQSFGDYLIPIVLLAFYFIARKNARLFSYLSAIVVFLAFIMTFSTGAWVGAAVAILIYLGLAYRINGREFYRRLGFIIIPLLAVGFALNLYLWPSYYKSFVGPLSKIQVWKVGAELKVVKNKLASEETVFYDPLKVDIFDDKITRLWMAQTAMNMFNVHPILGIGPGSYGFLYNSYRPEGTPIKKFIERTHNLYLQVLAENGMIGLILFLGIIIVPIHKLFRKWKLFKEPEDRLLAITLLAGFIGLLAHGLSYGVIQHSYFWVYLGLLMAVLEVL